MRTWGEWRESLDHARSEFAAAVTFMRVAFALERPKDEREFRVKRVRECAAEFRKRRMAKV